MDAMKAVVDVYYRAGQAAAACVLFRKWTDDIPSAHFRTVLPATHPYRAGHFYQRELPCLLAVLEQAGGEFEVILVDGYVHLRPDMGKGLGFHLWESLPYSPAVIGVAKNPLTIADRFIPVHRGRSAKPLFVSAIGCDVHLAARRVARMHGSFRIPTLLMLADHYSRKG